MKKTIYSILSLIALLSTSCNYLDVDPVGQVIPEKASEFRALMTAGYKNFPDRHKSTVTIRTDELDLCSEYSWSYESWFDLATWNDLSGNPKLMEFSYDGFYKTIFYANHTIAEEGKIQDDDTESITQIVAEAYAMRAFAHFELVNMYAQPYSNETLDSKAIPLSVVIDTEQEFPRATLGEVYAQIWSDINSAEERMEIASQPESSRYRFSKESMLAFKTRVSLYQKEWQKAYDYATELIALRPQLQDLNAEGALPPYNYKSVEAVQSLTNFIHMDVRDDFPVSEKLLGMYNQENDLRFAMYFKKGYGAYKINKGSTADEKSTFRMGEVYLNAAEAALQLNRIDEAKQLLATLTSARLKPEFFASEQTRITAYGKEEMIKEIADERQRELALEGFRWYDLRRTTRARIEKSTFTNTYVLEENDARYTLRFPKSAIANNPNLID